MQESFFRELTTDEEGNVILSVEECHVLISSALERVGRVRVRGELSRPSVVRGQMAFFDLKDANGKEFVLECALFGFSFQRFRHLLQDGMEVMVGARVNLYKTGRLRLIVEDIEPYGEGAWRRAFEALKKKLAGKGYFAKERKRPIPQIAQRIGLITSEEGQAVFDFRKNLGEYGFQLLLYPVWVEGDRAEKSIVRAFHWFQKNRSDMDILVLMRGGGGFENLKAFNSEKIADAIAASRIPVITGIGHEKDESIADYVADKSLSTPTAVAVFLRAQREDVMRSIDALADNMKEKMRELLEETWLSVNSRAQSLELATARVFERHHFAVRQMAEKLHRGFGGVFEAFAHVRQRLVRQQYRYEHAIYGLAARVEKASVALASLNPENVLQRGYSVVFTRQKRVLKNSQDVGVGEKVAVRLWKGALGTRVEEKK